jgi:hypothetical protein
MSKKLSPEIQNLSLLRNTASSALRATRSILIQLRYPRLESTAFLSYSGSPMNIIIPHFLFFGQETYFRCSNAT